MGEIRTKDVRAVVASLDNITKYYREEYSKKENKKDWRTYSQSKTHRMRQAAKELKPLVHKAASEITVIKDNNRGRKPEFGYEEKVLFLLIKEIFKLSNRDMADFLFFFSLMSDIDVSYKTIERLYSDEVVQLILHNMFVLLVKEKKICEIDAAGDGTGYSLSIKKNYCDSKDTGKNRKDFVYSFSLLDLDTLMYAGIGYSRKSERDAYNKAISMAKGIGIEIKSIRLDRYYSNKSIVDDFGEYTEIYIIPKKNVIVRGSRKWKSILNSFVSDTYAYLKKYFMRNLSESMNSFDKNRFGGFVRQKLDERIEQCLFARGVLHNLFWFYG